MKYIGIIWLITIVLSTTFLIMGNSKMVTIILSTYWLIRLYDSIRRKPTETANK